MSDRQASIADDSPRRGIGDAVERAREAIDDYGPESSCVEPDCRFCADMEADTRTALARDVLALAAALADAERQRDEARESLSGALAAAFDAEAELELIGGRLVNRNTDLAAAEVALADTRQALRGLHDHYVRLVDSGDCGHWNADEEPQVIAARAVLDQPK